MQLIKQLIKSLWSHRAGIKDIVQIIQSILTIIGIIVAAYWFFKRRQVNPKAKLTHNIINKVLDENTLLIRINATIENIGNVLIKIDHVEIRINWVYPLTEDVHTAIDKLKPVNELESEEDLQIKFPQIESKKLKLEKNKMIIVEPGESENIYCDFILKKDKLPSKVKTIMIYCYIKNISSRQRPLGWVFEELYDLSITKKNYE